MQILRNYPMPQKMSKYMTLYRMMKVGDALAPLSPRQVARIRNWAYDHGQKIMARQQGDGTYMIWRKK